MANKYITDHYSTTWEEDYPQKEPQKTLSDIVFLVKGRVGDALDDPNTKLHLEHPRTLISIVVTNILVNLLFHSVAVKDISRRLDMLQECLDEIQEMTYELWNSLEAAKADVSSVN